MSDRHLSKLTRVVLIILLLILFVGGDILMQKESKGSQPSTLRTIWTSYIQVIVVAFVLVFGFIRPFIVEAFKIPSGSMMKTLLVGDRILVCKFAYGIKIPLTDYRILDFHKPQRGDVIVFVPPHEPHKNFIKRIVALEGDTVEVRNKKLYVNGKEIDDSAYTAHMRNRSLRPYGPSKVPKGRFFAMGDNREGSQDSRYWGPADLNEIKGRAFMIYWSSNSHKDPYELDPFLQEDKGRWPWWQFFRHIQYNRIGRIVKSQFDANES